MEITAQAELFALLLVEGCATVQARVAQDFVSLGRGERPGARAQRACKRATTIGGAEEHSASTLRLARRGARPDAMRQNFLSGTLLAGGRIEDALGSFFAVHFSGTIIFPLEPLSFLWNHYLFTGTIILPLEPLSFHWNHYRERRKRDQRVASDDLRLIPGLAEATPKGV